MIRIDCFIIKECDACKIAIRNITNAINEANFDVTLNVRTVNVTDKNIKIFPTIVIYKKLLSNELKKLARLEGSFPIDYIKDIIDKLKKE